MKNLNNKKPWKKAGAVLLCATFFVSSMALSLSAADAVNIQAQLSPNYKIVVDGVQRDFYSSTGQEVHPIVYNGTTYLPLRAIGELMGKNVNWDQSTLTVTLSGTRTSGIVTGTPDTAAKSQTISAQLRPDFTIVLDGVKRTFTDSKGNAQNPLLYNGTTYLPLRAIGQLMGKTVEWDGNTDTVTLTSNSLVTDADTFQNSGSTGSTGNIGNVTNPASSTGLITEAAAREKALSHAGVASSDATFIRAHLEWDDGRQIYDVEFYTKDYKEYDYEIDAKTGEVLSFDYDADYYTPSYNQNNNNGSYISQEEARNIALAQVSGATADNVIKLKLDYDDGRAEYDVEIVYGTREYEFEIDAATGRILQQESDSIFD